MNLPTQSQITRLIKAVVAAHHAAGLTVTGTTVSFSQGEPTIAVTTEPDSAQRSPVKGEPNVTDLQEALRKRHAARRT